MAERYLNSPGRKGGGPPLLPVVKWLGVGFGFAALLAFLVGSWFYWKLHGSLPPIDGSAKVHGLGATVKLERDSQGVPTITGQSYLDIARALGFAHGQDRFFQMDLARRRAAGELAEIFGSAALPLDRRARIHDFRPLAERVLQGLAHNQRAALEAYAGGVNAGLATLAVKPFEYIVLRTKPAAWKAEDCLLVSYSMALILQDDQGQYLRTLQRVRTVLGEKAVDYFSPRVGPMDAALDGSSAPLPAMPRPTVINLRGKVETAEGEPERAVDTEFGAQPARRGRRAPPFDPPEAGSNSLAVAGPPGTAVLANDMHLNLQIPNTWYRASLVWPGHRLTGVTLPGTPAVVAGSNGKVAWGLTNSLAGTGDLILVNTDLQGFYRGPDADEFPLKPHVSAIKVKGGPDVQVSTDWTVWGPVVAQGENNQLLVYHWAVDDPGATDFGFMALSDATTVAEAIEAAHQVGIPDQNFLAADAKGEIGWTIAGRLPKRVGFDGRWAVLFEYKDRKWAGWLDPKEVPVVTGRPYLWTANQRMLGGADLEKLGDSGYLRAARAAQIRDDLKALVETKRRAAGASGEAPKTLRYPAPADLLKIELDDRAVFLEWWRDLALQYLGRGPVRDAVEHDCAAAGVESKGYGFVRDFRQRVARAVMDPIFSACAEDDDNFNWARLNYEPALREILTKKPIHLLDSRFESWDDLIKAQLKASPEALEPWGRRNLLRIVHPFSLVLPRVLTGWLNLPAVPVPGDNDMPRVQAPSFGASERFAVSPGHEDQGIFEMPGGESGHPLSPFYAAGHENWVLGKPSPFLPGPAAHTLMLTPE